MNTVLNITRNSILTGCLVAAHPLFAIASPPEDAPFNTGGACAMEFHRPGPPMGPPFVGPPLGTQHLPPYLMGVTLTEDQQDKVFAILHAAEPALREQEKAVRKARDGLRDLVRSAQFDAGSRGKIGNLGNQRTATVGVQVSALAVGGAHFPDASQALETLQQIWGVPAKAEAQEEAAGNGSLQLLRGSQSDDAAMINDGEALTQRVGLFHVVSGQQNRFAALVVFADDFPQEQTGLRVQASTRLVQEKDLRIVHHGASDGETLHHAAGESANHLVGAIGELEAVEKSFRTLGAFVRGNAEIGAMEGQNLAGSKRKIQIGALGDNANQALDGDLLLPHVVFADEGLATGGADARSKNANGGGLAGAVGPQQAEDFSRQYFKRDSIEGDDFRFWLFAFGFRRAEREAPRASGRGGCCSVDLAKVACANASHHAGVPLSVPTHERSGAEALEQYGQWV